jgi:hypothetical protein
MKNFYSFFLIMVLTISSAFSQKQMFGEFFVSNEIAEYDSINTLCAQSNMIYIMNHFRSTDTLSNSDVSKRMSVLNETCIPSTHINGYRVADYDWINPDAWQNKYNLSIEQVANITATCKIETLPLNPPIKYIKTFVNLNTTSSYNKVILILSENFPNTKFKHVTRKILYDTLWNDNEIKFALLYNNKWNLDNCELTVIIENESHKVIGISQKSLSESINTGIDDVLNKNEIVVYPNPTTDNITIKCTVIPKNIRIVNSIGQVLVNKFDFENEIYTYKFESKGLYFIVIDGKSYKIVKE